MDKLKSAAVAVQTWVMSNPTKAALIITATVAFVAGAVIF